MKFAHPLITEILPMKYLTGSWLIAACLGILLFGQQALLGQNEPQFEKFVLFNTDTDLPIQELTDGTVLVYADTLQPITIVGQSSGTAGSAEFIVSGPFDYEIIENNAPYSLNGDGDNGPNYFAWPYSFGVYTLTFNLYEDRSGRGTIADSKTIQFEIRKEEVAPPPPPPVPPTFDCKDSEGSNIRKLYVNQNATGANTGLSWEDAYTSLQTAFQMAQACQRVKNIWVAAGTYTPSSTDNPTESFVFRDELRVYGGFTGGEEKLNQRDWIANPTIMSGAIGTSSATDNSWHILKADTIEESIVLDGFIIRDGYAGGSSSDRHGAGFKLTDVAKAEIANCTFMNNLAPDGDGGAIHLFNSTAKIEYSSFYDNSARGDGGAIYIHKTASSISIDICTFQRNQSTSEEGGAVAANGTRQRIVSSLFLDNEANQGGGVYVGTGGVLDVLNGTFSRNKARNQLGDALRVRGSTSVLNSIFWGNETDDPVSVDGTGLIINYSLVEGGFNGISNLNKNPRFINPAADDYSLLYYSPVINTGLTSGSILADDLAGNARILGTGVDMGAYEFLISDDDCADVIYVKEDAEGKNNGKSWKNAFTDLQDALGRAKFCPEKVEIWVAAGVYRPTKGTDPDIAFQLLEDVEVYGGFIGNEKERDERDWVNNRTNLSGDIATNELEDNSWHVVRALNCENTAVLDGFTIRRGYAGGEGYERHGAGILVLNSQPQFEANPLIINCRFIKNIAPDGDGAALYNDKGSPIIENCFFSQNEARGDGGAILTEGPDSHPKIIKCIFQNNLARKEEGGAVFSFSPTILVDNSIFAQNEGNKGGGMYTGSKSVPTIINSTFFRNTTRTSDQGSGLNMRGNGKVVNTIFWDNNGGDPIAASKQLTEVTFSIVQGGYPGQGNLSLNPLFLNTSILDLRLTASSPAVNAGSNSAFSQLTDLDGNPRIQDGRIDMGPYEFFSPEPVCPPNAILYVNQAATGSNDGSSWENAFTDLQDALKQVAFCDEVSEIWVAQGTYLPSQTGDEFTSFELVDSVALYGGFDGTEVNRGQRDWENNETRLSGVLSKSLSSQRIISAVSVTGVLLNGFTVEGAVLDSFNPGGFANGAGMLISGTESAEAQVVVRNCTFKQNRIFSAFGGAVYANYARASFFNVLFIGNWGEDRGGGISAKDSRIRTSRCVFTQNNSDTSSGGAIDAVDSRLNIDNSLFTFNGANAGGEAIYARATRLTITNSTFYRNDGNFREAISIDEGKKGFIINSIFWDHQGAETSEASLDDPNNDITVTYTLMQHGKEGTGNIDADPMFTDPDNGDFTLQPGSPAIDAGLDSVAVGNVDLAGMTRIQNAAIDMGAYELNITELLPVITGLALINSETNEQVGMLSMGDFINMDKFSGGINIEAITNENTHSVIFELEGPETFTRAENVAPWALFGDSGGNFFAWFPTKGDYVLVATPYSEKGAKGFIGAPYVYEFTIGDNSENNAVPADDLVVTYPNPSDGNFTIRMEEEVSLGGQLSLMDEFGQIYWQDSSTQPTRQLQLSHLRPGIYVLRYQGNNRAFVKRIVIAK